MNSRSSSLSARSWRRPSLPERRRSQRRSTVSSVEQGQHGSAPDPAVHAISEEIAEIKRYEDFTTIDWVLDDERQQLRRRARREEHAGILEQEISYGWRRKLWEAYDAGQAWLVVTIVGAVIGLNAAALNIITEWLSDVKLGYCRTAFYLNEQFCCWGAENGCGDWQTWTSFRPINYFLYIIFSILFAFIASFLVKKYAAYAAGSGISEIKCIIAGFIMQGFLGTWTFFIKSVGLPFAIASGLSVGKEGPSVHYAVCAGNIISRYFEKYRGSASKTREILTATAAAGVAVAFGSPIGGVLFSLEEMASYFPLKTLWRSYFCALVATAVLAAMNPFRTGQLVMFQVKYDRTWHFFELIFFGVIGVLGGLYGAFVIKWNLRAQAFRKKYLTKFAIPEAAILAGATAILCFPNSFLRIDMTEMMEMLFQECEGDQDYSGICEVKNRWSTVFSLLVATIFRVMLVIISYGCKVPAGIFVPSMAIGASCGRMIGILVQSLHESFPQSRFFSACEPDIPCITPGTYAFLGAAAALSGIMHITVSVTVIMFELTGALTYILPTMIVVGITKAVGDRFGKGGIADRMIWFNGYPFIDNKEEHSFGVSVAEAMKSSDLHILPGPTVALTEVENLLRSTSFSGFPIVENTHSNILIGYIGRTELQFAIDRAKKQGLISPSARCSFIHDHDEAAQDLFPSSPSSSDMPGRSTANVARPISHSDESSPPITFDAIATSSGVQIIDFSPFVVASPIAVHPRLPLEIVMEMFKKIGPRVILVERRGQLVGLVTVKDCLKFQFRGEGIHSFPQRREADDRQRHESGGDDGIYGVPGIQSDEKLWHLIERTAQWIVNRVDSLKNAITGGRVGIGGNWRSRNRHGPDGSREDNPWSSAQHGRSGITNHSNHSNNTRQQNLDQTEDASARGTRRDEYELHDNNRHANHTSRSHDDNEDNRNDNNNDDDVLFSLDNDDDDDDGGGGGDHNN